MSLSWSLLLGSRSSSCTVKKAGSIVGPISSPSSSCGARRAGEVDPVDRWEVWGDLPPSSFPGTEPVQSFVCPVGPDVVVERERRAEKWTPRRGGSMKGGSVGAIRGQGGSDKGAVWGQRGQGGSMKGQCGGARWKYEGGQCGAMRGQGGSMKGAVWGQ